ncbi:MAG TPA: alpha/beta hydrolase [Acidimicrobiales bacterium]|jgi:pimeloyl-ACP methyl ester carboxylesterase|nr:alpha/beta hydrolase [Acidimicrobiales bacterium]
MPIAEIGDLEIAYEIIGSGRPWVITPGGRFGKDYGGVRELGLALAERGQQAIIWDRPNCGESSVNFTGSTESIMQADTLAALLRQLDVGPTVIIGGSGGARISLLAAARNPDVAAGLGIWWISGGPFGNMTLASVYCWPSLEAVWNGTMEDVANLETWEEVIRRNPHNRARFLAQDRTEFRETMQRWGHAYCACGDPLVPGLSGEEAAAMVAPILVFRSGESDMFHTRAVSERLAANLPSARLAEPPWGDREWIERQESALAGGALFERWSLLAPQLVEWADELVTS